MTVTDARRLRAKAVDCNMSAAFESVETVNIYNSCGAAPGAAEPDSPVPGECPPPATGACIPLSPGAKHKQSMARKLEKLARNQPAPSVIAGAIMQQARRYLSGVAPGNPLEASVFAVFGRLSPRLHGTLACAVGMLDATPKANRDQVFDPRVLAVGERALTPSEIAEPFISELEAKLADAVFDHSGCVEEHPGLPRPVFSTINGGVFLGFIPKIFRINGLRTFFFEPPLAVGDYEPDEFEQICEPEIQDGEVVPNCRFQTADCPGHQLGPDGPCLRAPDVRPGETVILEGLNFFNIAARVRLRAKPPGTATAEVEAFVCGDDETPATETKGDEEVPINDSRVHDRLTFQIPDEFAVGIYEVSVVVPNDTGVPDTDSVYISDPVFLKVLPPVDATFQIALETLRAEKETSPARFGSDEVGLRVVTIPVFLDQGLGAASTPVDVRFGDVDSGETRDISRVILGGSGLAGASIAVVGFEIDSERAFENEIDNFTEAFVDIAKRVWDAIKEEVGAAVGGIVKKFGVKGLLAVLAAAVVATGIIAIVALWAPADLIIEDNLSLPVTTLATLSNANFPAPEQETYGTAGEIEVTVVPLEKRADYRERREYRSDDEDSEYHLFLRYSRIA